MKIRVITLTPFKASKLASSIGALLINNILKFSYIANDFIMISEQPLFYFFYGLLGFYLPELSFVEDDKPDI
jgi:hypothetical protein